MDPFWIIIGVWVLIGILAKTKESPQDDSSHGDAPEPSFDDLIKQVRQRSAERSGGQLLQEPSKLSEPQVSSVAAPTSPGRNMRAELAAARRRLLASRRQLQAARAKVAQKPSSATVDSVQSARGTSALRSLLSSASGKRTAFVVSEIFASPKGLR